MFKGFAQLRQSLTIIVYLRRISRSLHRANELAETRLRLDYPAQYKAGVTNPHRSKARLMEVGVATTESLNRAWQDRHPLESNEGYLREHDID